MATKYICFNTGVFDDAVIFSDLVSHSNMARMLGLNKEQILSAGFVVFSCDVDGFSTINPYGNSVSLGVGTNDMSAEIIKRTLNPDGY